MPTKISESSVEALVLAYKTIPDVEQACSVNGTCFILHACLQQAGYGQVGLNFVVDHSGKLFKGKKCTLKDVVANTEDTRQDWLLWRC